MLTHTERWHVAIEKDGHFEMVGGGGLLREEAEQQLAEARETFTGAFLMRLSMDRI